MDEQVKKYLTDNKLWSHEYARRFGYLTNNEISFLKSLVSMLENHTSVLNIANIGVGSGTSTLAIRESAPTAQIYSFDISEGGALGGLENEKNAFAEAGYKLPTQILCDSKSIKLGYYFDFVFIDGGHLKDEIEGDLNNFVPRIKVNGLLTIHDYDLSSKAKWPDVVKVVDYRCGHFDGLEYIGVVDTIIAFKVYYWM